MRAASLAALCLMASAGLSSPSFAGKFGPSAIVEQARAQPDAILHFIVRGTPSGRNAARALLPSQPGEVAEDLPLIDGVLLALKVSDAEALAKRDDVEQVYYVRTDMTQLYSTVIRALGSAWTTAPAPGVVSMSLGPDNAVMPLASDADDPINLATGKVADKGFAMVMAIGNYYDVGSPRPGITNPWCRPQWIICVGAASADAAVLLDESARGMSGDKATWPTVVAYGVNVLSSWPAHVQKTPKQQARDAASAEWRALPKDVRDDYAVMSGTSQATGQVSRAASQVLWFVQQTLSGMNGVKRGDVLFSIDVPQAQFDSGGRLGPRLNGDVAQPVKGAVRITYRVDEPWKIAKQVLIDTAQPMPGFAPEAVGAGFVSPDYIDAQFGRFNVGAPRILPLKVIP